MLDSGLLATAVKVSKSCHNSTIKSLIQNSPILFQDNITISLHCTFQSLMFSNGGENANSISRNDTLTHSHTHTHNDYCMPPVGSAHRGIINVHEQCNAAKWWTHLMTCVCRGSALLTNGIPFKSTTNPCIGVHVHPVHDHHSSVIIIADYVYTCSSIS